MKSRLNLLAAAALVALTATAGAQEANPLPDEPPAKAEEEEVPAEENSQDQTPPAPGEAQPTPAPAAQAEPQAAPPASAPESAPPTATAPPAQPPAQPAAETPAPAGPAPQPQTAPAATPGAVTAATATDLTVGAAVLDPQGGTVGTIESVDAQGVVVATGTVRARLPAASFGRNAQGLVISVTKAGLEAAVAARNPS